MSRKKNEEDPQEQIGAFIEAVSSGANNRGLNFCLYAWYYDPIGEVIFHKACWNSDLLSARGAAHKLLSEIIVQMDASEEEEDDGA